MSTDLHKLIKAGKLREIHLPLAPGQTAFRRVFVTQEFDRWAATLTRDVPKGARASDVDELIGILSRFISGAKIVTFLRWIMPRGPNGCVTLQPPGLTLAGWAPEDQILVLCDGARASESHGSGSKTKPVLAASVKRQRRELGFSDYRVGELNVLFRPASRLP